MFSAWIISLNNHYHLLVSELITTLSGKYFSWLWFFLLCCLLHSLLSKLHLSWRRMVFPSALPTLHLFFFFPHFSLQNVTGAVAVLNPTLRVARQRNLVASVTCYWTGSCSPNQPSNEQPSLKGSNFYHLLFGTRPFKHRKNAAVNLCWNNKTAKEKKIFASRN